MKIPNALFAVLTATVLLSACRNDDSIVEETYESTPFAEAEIVEWYEIIERHTGWGMNQRSRDETGEWITEYLPRYTAIIPTNPMLLNDEYLFEFMDSQRRGVGSRTTSDRSYGNVQHIILDFGDGTGYMISNNGLQIRSITHENNGEYELAEGRRGSLYPVGTSSPTEIRWSEVSNLS